MQSNKQTCSCDWRENVFFYSAHEMKNALVKKKSVRVLKGVERLESRFNVKERSVVVEEGSVVCAVI